MIRPVGPPSRQITGANGASVSGRSSSVTARRRTVSAVVNTWPSIGSTMSIDQSQRAGFGSAFATVKVTEPAAVAPVAELDAAASTVYTPSQNERVASTPGAVLPKKNGTPFHCSYDQLIT